MEQKLLASLLQEHSRTGRIQEFTLSQNPLGKPYLWVEGLPGPPVSFSRSAGRLWAAVGTPKSWLGLDAASPGEFAGAYPFQRVFQETEWQAAISLTGGDREEAGALLWSVKEAVVKARGCGYHFFGPRQIRLEFAGPGEHGPCWRGHLETPVPAGIPPGSRGTISAASVRLHQVWLSVAWMTVAPGNALPRGG
jgi:phosphopantetheinyl transferase